MVTTIALGTGIISLVFGILVLAFPKFLRYFVGIYFIVIGLLQLFL